jgi:hypothetical protein
MTERARNMWDVRVFVFRRKYTAYAKKRRQIPGPEV